jgi:acetyltransferase-like isoleucine patch superfamily enzyme
VFLGRDVDLAVRPGHGRIVLGSWVHLGDGTRLRAHEGTLRIGDKVVLGANNTINCLLDIEIGAASLLSDWIYICDFDHVYADLEVPIKDQGVVKSPVRIGPDCWIGVKVTVLRGASVGRGSVLAAHTVVRGVVPAESVVAGVPGRVVKSRRPSLARRDAGRPTDPDGLVALSRDPSVTGIGFDQLTGEYVAYLAQGVDASAVAGAADVRLATTRFSEQELEAAAYRIADDNKAAGIRVVTAGPLPDLTGIQVWVAVGQLSRIDPDVPASKVFNSVYPIRVAGELEVAPAAR